MSDDFRRHTAHIGRVFSSQAKGAALAGYEIDGQLRTFGEHVHRWRMVLGLTAQQVADRAGITRDSLCKIETGDPGVRFGSVMQVLRALGALDQAVDAIGPLSSDIGRLRAGNLAKKRAR